MSENAHTSSATGTEADHVVALPTAGASPHDAPAFAAALNAWTRRTGFTVPADALEGALGRRSQEVRRLAQAEDADPGAAHEPATFRLGACTIRLGGHWIETKLPDGSSVFGAPHHTESYRATAAANGYGADVARMNSTHEITHTLLAHVLGLKASPTFYRVSAGQHDATEGTRVEEEAVMALERYANHYGVDLIEAAQRWSQR